MNDTKPKTGTFADLRRSIESQNRHIPAHRETPTVLPTRRTDFIRLPVRRRLSPSMMRHIVRVYESERRLIVTLGVTLSALALLLVMLDAWLSAALTSLVLACVCGVLVTNHYTLRSWQQLLASTKEGQE